MTAETLMLLGGGGAFALTVWWVRRRELREKYAAAWVLLAAGLLVLGLFPGLLHAAAHAARLSYPAAVLFGALVVIYLFSFSVSVALSTLDRRTVRLAQQVGLLEQRVRELEAGTGRPAGSRTGGPPCESG